MLTMQAAADRADRLARLAPPRHGAAQEREYIAGFAPIHIQPTRL
jgi:hypothetical protein